MFITSEMKDSVSSEAYKSLRTAIRYCGTDKPIKTIVITSALSEEGKSTVAGNLAISLSESGVNVLLIDCDLRNPTLHKRLDLSNGVGITNFLISDSTLKETMIFIKPKLAFISAGKKAPNPSEILGSNTMSKFINEMKETVDYIIFDTPPVIPVTDSKLLAAKCDATILVVRANKSKEKYTLEAYKELKKVGANVIGTVFNDSEDKHKNKYYYCNEDRGKKKKYFKKKNKEG